MKLIADSGSSKTDWLLLTDNNEEQYIHTKGINPFFLNENEIIGLLQETFSLSITEQVTEIYFYGAGCIKNTTSKIVETALNSVFQNAKTEVNDDMTGAARALFGKESGIACILGTGANSCLYNGTEIVDKVPALGFILGDEGSGAYLGKELLNSYFKRFFPSDLARKFEEEFQPELGQVLSSVYKEAYPSRYLAKFSFFISKNVAHPFIHNLLYNAFTAFFQKNIMKYEGYKSQQLAFCGSIAFYYEEVIKKVASSNGLKISSIISTPIQNLGKFHK